MSVGIGIYGPNEKNQMHEHKEADEAMIFLREKGVFKTPTKSYDIKPNTVFTTRPGEKHRIENTGNEDLYFIFAYASAGPEKCIKDLTSQMN